VKKLRVGVIYGGRSGEHEVSVASAASIIKHLDRSRYEPVPIRIEKDGRWTLADKPPSVLKAAEVIESARRLQARGPPAPDAKRTSLPIPAKTPCSRSSGAATGTSPSRARLRSSPGWGST
jgi:D-alanine-D-alanine ligase